MLCIIQPHAGVVEVENLPVTVLIKKLIAEIQGVYMKQIKLDV